VCLLDELEAKGMLFVLFESHSYRYHIGKRYDRARWCNLSNSDFFASEMMSALGANFVDPVEATHAYGMRKGQYVLMVTALVCCHSKATLMTVGAIC
jgi:hypothetical protein